MKLNAVDRLNALADLVDEDGRFTVMRDENGRYTIQTGLVHTSGQTTFDDAVDAIVAEATDHTWRTINISRAALGNLEHRAAGIERISK